MVNGSLTEDDVEENLNIIEDLLRHTDASDNYMAAMLQNQKMLLQAFSEPYTSPTGESTNVPGGTAGVAVDDISQGDIGQVLFKINGRTVISNFRAAADIANDEVVRVGEGEDKVYPVNNVDQSKLDFGEISFASSLSTKFIFEETGSNVQVGPGEEDIVLEVNVDSPVGWYETGTNDKTYTKYQYIVDGEEMLSSPIKKPLGLYNNMYRFPEPIKVASSLKIKVIRNSSASSTEEYFSNVVLM